ncbi:MAG TPA: LysM peptidoglycan-binding domain-containing protein, partial [Pyrinomonadaceae bacterium]
MSTRTHTVSAGETLSAIAREAGLTLAEIMAANLNIKDPDVVAVGQTIFIPSSSAGGPAAAVAVAETRIYTVRGGDTLGVIARRYGVEVAELLAANNIANPDRIRAGQQLTIPVKGAPAEPKPRPAEAAPQNGGGQPQAVEARPQNGGGPAGADANAILARCRPSGASERTARQDRLTVTGVAASRRMAATDARMVLPYMSKFDEAARAHGLPPALLAGIASRESRGGAILARDGTGDNGHGFGL